MIFKQVFRIAFVTFIWKQYKAWIVSTLLLLAAILIIGQIHSDLLQAWTLNQDTTNVSSSLFYKWLAYILCIAIYVLFHTLRNKKSPKNSSKKERKKLEQELAALPSNEDPFNEIRKRKKLRSKSDFLLDSNSKKSDK